MFSELHIFDFDGTIFKSPKPPNGDWYDPKSLQNIGDLDSLYISKTVEDIKASIENPNIYVVVMTGRNLDVRYEVENLLLRADIVPDELITNDEEEDPVEKYKCRYIEDLLNNFNNVQVVHMWEDNLDGLKVYEKCARKLGVDFVAHPMPSELEEISFRIMKRLLKEAASRETIEKVEAAITNAGGEVYMVGGSVRDAEMGFESKDIDILVRNLDFPAIKDALSPIGRVIDQDIGGKLHMLKFNIDGQEFDITIPRTSETSTGAGHAEVDIDSDPYASVESDLGRRDFTFNALARDSQGQVIDKFGGLNDIKNKIVRAVGNPHERFREDPLRMLRALQFASRFGFNIEQNTAKAIKDHLDLFQVISGERILIEFVKAWTKGKADSETFVNLLKNLNVGEAIFGEDFEPYAIQMTGDAKDKAMGNFVAFFLRGGDPMQMKPTNEMMAHLETAKKIVNNESDIWRWGKRNILSTLAEAFNQLYESTKNETFEDAAVRINRALALPLKMKELAVSGGELAKMGLHGKEIGQTQVDIMRAIHAGSIQNSKEDILNFIA
jgi:tRNA nucleotidyltransferase (CCA-adding enzyme)